MNTTRENSLPVLGAVPPASAGQWSLSIFSVIVAIAAAGSWPLLVVGLTIWVSASAEVLGEFGVALPWLSVVVISFARWSAGQSPGQVVPGFVLILPLLVLMWGLVPLAAMRSTRRTAVIVSILLLLIAAVVQVLGILAITIPMAAVTKSLETGGS